MASKKDPAEWAAYMLAWYHRNREKVRARLRSPHAKAIKAAWKAKNAAKLKAQQIAYDASHRAQSKARREANADALKEKSRAYYQANKERIKTAMRSPEHREIVNAQNRARYAADPEYRTKVLALANASRRRNPEKYRANAQAKRLRRIAKDPEAFRAKKVRYEKERAARDPNYKLSRWCRLRIRQATKLRREDAKAAELLGCSIPEFRAHIERQFKPGMSWENWARKGWHIDHIRPLASFDLTDPAQQAAAFHWSNQQPLWWRENLSKGARAAQLVA